MNELELVEFVDAVERRGEGWAERVLVEVLARGMTKSEADVANAELARRGSNVTIEVR